MRHRPNMIRAQENHALRYARHQAMIALLAAATLAFPVIAPRRLNSYLVERSFQWKSLLCSRYRLSWGSSAGR